MAPLQDILDQTFETTRGALAVRAILAADRNTVFLSYPGDFSPVCTKQFCTYRDMWAALQAVPCLWWGINTGTVEQHTKFRETHRLPFDLIADPQAVLLRALGLSSWLRPKRGVALVTPDGTLAHQMSVWPWTYPTPDALATLVRGWMA
ncbi:MAG: peroxiredoxin family protein [Deltaproteobacteria bacterium]|nr:peroxiredoxin family protein [Deltaproteobacteria bacterium]